MHGLDSTHDAVSQELVAIIRVGVFALPAVDLNVILPLRSMMALVSVRSRS